MEQRKPKIKVRALLGTSNTSATYYSKVAEINKNGELDGEETSSDSESD